jgi:uncharacterized protein (DUF2342 family)
MGDDGGGRKIIDWDLARATGARLMARSPSVSTFEAIEVVDALHRFAHESVEHVERFTGLVAPVPGPPTLVIDRRRWLDINVDGFARR